MKPPPPPERIDIKADDLHALVERTKLGPLSDEDYSILKRVIETFLWLLLAIESAQATISDLRRQLFGSKSEKSKKVLDKGKDKPGGDDKGSNAKEEPKKPRKGHGRKPASDYTGAQQHECHHESLRLGDRCPKCGKGKLYALTPSVVVCVTGQAPLIADRYVCDRLRCNLCGEVFTAELPPEAKRPKYDETCVTMIALLKYGTGLPFNRLERLERNLGIPLPASTQWEIVAKPIDMFAAVYAELIRRAAQGDIAYNDDTKARVLALGDGAADNADESESELESDFAPGERTGTFTSAIVVEGPVGKIALFFTGWKHAGENLARVLKERDAELPPPIQMCDGLDRNIPAQFKTVLANCLLHGRRKFVALIENFQEDCRFVIESLAEVYRVDERAREDDLSPNERLLLHQEESGPVMEALEIWMRKQLDEKKVEPNSGLGKAIQYMLKRWDKLTLFLQVPGAPLDNNLCERAIKKVCLHRKNSLFYKTENGARVADIYMSLIHTCELHGENPYDYLTALQRNTKHVMQDPSQWMPWNYRATLAVAAESVPQQRVAAAG